jgi:hypothetical protein
MQMSFRVIRDTVTQPTHTAVGRGGGSQAANRVRRGSHRSSRTAYLALTAPR